MSADLHSSNYYDRLAIESDASREEVKSAYSRAVRLYNPERYPEEFKRIREAYETLYDPESRAEYDASTNPAIAAAIQQGQDALAEEKYEDAIKAFKKALVLSPQTHYIRNLLGLAYLYSSCDEEALEQFVTLTKDIPHNTLYWNHRGLAERRLSHWEAAERSFRRAIDIDPGNTDAIEGLARSVFFQDRKEEAAEILESAIHADGIVDFEDFSFFFELIYQKILQGDVEAIRALAERIDSSLSEEWQRRRVAYRFAVLANELVEINAFALAVVIAERANALARDDETINGLTESIRAHHDTIEQWTQLQEDPAIRDSFKFTLSTLIRTYFGWWESETEKDELLRTAYDVLVREAQTLRYGKAGWTLKDELDYINREYPAIGRIPNDQIVQIIDVGAKSARFIWISCPHCGNQARAAHETSNYTCPQCSRNFSYNAHSGQTNVAVQQGSGCLSVFIGLAIMVSLLCFLV